jgi:hypothetical protein
MTDILSILTEEQVKTLTEEQKQKFSVLMSQTNNLSTALSKFNELLKAFFLNIEFSQHDSEYRPRNDKIFQVKASQIKNEILKLTKEYPNLHNEVYMFGKKYYKLSEYYYAEYDRDTYVAVEFCCVSREEFNKYCEKNNIGDIDELILKSHNTRYKGNEPETFAEYMKMFKEKYTYIHPSDIEIYEPETYNGEFPFHFGVFSKFNFVNILKLRDLCQKTMK